MTHQITIVVLAELNDAIQTPNDDQRWHHEEHVQENPVRHVKCTDSLGFLNPLIRNNWYSGEYTEEDQLDEQANDRYILAHFAIDEIAIIPPPLAWRRNAKTSLRTNILVTFAGDMMNNSGDWV